MAILLGALLGCDAPGDQTAGSSGGDYEIDRTVLPIQPPAQEKVTIMDARDAEKPETFSVEAPEGAPNVVVVLIDDIGFGATSTFGGAINTPTFDRLADNGLRFNRFHTTALCSPTRASLLSGRNHHNVNVGSVMEVATGFYGNQGIRPDNAKYFAETLKQNGYSTAAFGKWHENRYMGSVRFRAFHTLADEFRIRQVLWFHRRRNQPVGSCDLPMELPK